MIRGTCTNELKLIRIEVRSVKLLVKQVRNYQHENELGMGRPKWVLMTQNDLGYKKRLKTVVYLTKKSWVVT